MCYWGQRGTIHQDTITIVKLTTESQNTKRKKMEIIKKRNKQFNNNS